MRTAELPRTAGAACGLPRSLSLPGERAVFGACVGLIALEVVAADLGRPHREVSPRTSDGLDLAEWWVHGQETEELNETYWERAHPPKAIWKVPRGGHTGAMQAMPREYERRVVGFFDRYLLHRR